MSWYNWRNDHYENIKLEGKGLEKQQHPAIGLFPTSHFSSLLLLLPSFIVVVALVTRFDPSFSLVIVIHLKEAEVTNRGKEGGGGRKGNYKWEGKRGNLTLFFCASSSSFHFPYPKSWFFNFYFLPCVLGGQRFFFRR